MPSVTRKPQAKRQERREQIERRLLDATERLMRDGASFTELSVDRLATEAGMSRANMSQAGMSRDRRRPHAARPDHAKPDHATRAASRVQ